MKPSPARTRLNKKDDRGCISVAMQCYINGHRIAKEARIRRRVTRKCEAPIPKFEDDGGLDMTDLSNRSLRFGLP